jgi:peptidoglycan hydrolase-like protein with peptidoglycan-binding domain
MIVRNKVLAILLIFGLFPLFSHAETRNIVFPVDGDATFRNDFLEPRDGGARQHLGNDIIADKHTPLVAAVDGVISYMPNPEPSWGYMITIQDSDRYQYRYLHLNNDNRGTDDGRGGASQAYAGGLERGSKVIKGQLIGWVGDSGNAENTVPHLHFEIRRPDKTAINPYNSLFAAPRAENVVLNNNISSPQVDVGEAGVEEGAQFIFTINLKDGMRGDAIEELQKRLKESGHFTHSYTTKFFGSVTEEALKKYQRDNGIAPTGILGFETRALLNNDPVSKSGKLKLEKELFEGASGEPVIQVQLKLKELGYFVEEADGEFDSVLREAVRKFQNDKSLTPTGHVSYNTWNKLNEFYKAAPKVEVVTLKTSSTFSSTMSIGSRGDEIVTLQDRLRELGHFSPNIISTGYFGPVTRDAVISFQKAEGIDPVGFVGPQTYATLFSSETSLPTKKEVVSVEIEIVTPPVPSPPVPAGPHTFTENMTIGSRGNEVVALQDKLRELGHFSPNVVSTGYFGSITREAVISFQKSVDMEAAGVVGPKTRAALNSK